MDRAQEEQLQVEIKRYDKNALNHIGKSFYKGALAWYGKLTWESAQAWSLKILCYFIVWGITLIFMVRLSFMQFHC